jgi:lycopene cyclase domain-containing protein
LEYLVILVFVFFVCLAIKWKFNLKLFHSIRETLIVFGSLLVFGSIWDSFAIFRGYWIYDRKFLVGVTIGFMPLEEYLFMIVIPFLTLVVYNLSVKTRGRKEPR